MKPTVVCRRFMPFYFKGESELVVIKAREEVSKLTVARLAVYYSTLKKMLDESEQLCSSSQLGKRTGIPSSVIRRDLAYFGGFGTKGVGYEIEYLLSWVSEILGYNGVWNAVLAGRGIPFTGVSNYAGLLPPGFKIAAVIDWDKRNHGYKIPGLELTVNPPGNLANLIKSQAIAIGLITVPVKEAQKVANSMVKAGIRGIANFSPVSVCVPDGISLSQINVASCLSQLSYNLNNGLSESSAQSQPINPFAYALG